MKNNPYVGPRPYERGERCYFHGRKREVRDLLSLILAERVVLFYAPSGAGKTSLLNAQVIPALEEEDFDVLPATRVGSDLPPGVDPQDVGNIFVFSALMGLVGKDTSATFTQELTNHTLLSFLRQLCPEDKGDLDERPPVLILDQFEEILTTHRGRWQDARGFFEQVRDALRGMESLGVVFTMREDYVAGLDPYAPLLPRRLRARFRMERLDRKGALEAVKKPAHDAGCPFDPGVAERLVDDLRRIKGETHFLGETGFLGPFVEPVQLQVVCNRLWENLPEQEDSAIQWEEVQKFGDIDRALTDFYENALVRCVQETGINERKLRHWFNEQLITPIQTRGLALRAEHETGGLPNPAVDILEAQHLIRADVRAGARWYELSHDRMVDPILQSNRAWEMARQTPLRLAALRWRETGEDTGILYRGKTLDDALAWIKAHPSEIEPYELKFLEASRRAEQVRKRVNNLRIFGTVAAVLTIIVVSVLALEAYRASRVATSRGWASTSMHYLSINQEQSVIMAQIAIGKADTIEAQIALRQAIIDFYPAEVLKDTNTDHVVSVAYSPDGQLLSASKANGQVQVWDTKTHRAALTIDVGKDPINWIWGLAYSPDGRFLATGGNAPIRIWDTSTGAEVTSLSGHTGLVYGLAFSPDGRFLASGSRDATARVWDISTGTPVLTLTEHTGTVSSVDYSPDGRLLASGCWDGTVRLWEITAPSIGDLKTHAAMALTDHTAPVNSVVFSPDGKLLASGSDDKTIRIWDVTTGEAVLTLVGHTGPVMRLAFSPDGQLLISGSPDATVRIWNVAMRQKEAVAVLTGHTGAVNGVAYSPSGRFLASGAADRTVRVWDSTPPQGATLRALTGHERTVYSLDYSPDGRFLASGSADGTARIWATATGEPMMTLPIESTVWGVTYSPDGRYLVTCSADGLARLWDVSAGPPETPVMTLRGHEADVNVAAYSPNGRYLATASDDKTARLWDVSTGATLVTLVGHTDSVYALDYSPDGQSIATGSVDDDVRLWDVETGSLVATLSGHTDNVFNVAYSPDGTSLASASWDQTVRIWDLEEYTTTISPLVGHSGYVYNVAYSPDGNYLATSSWDRTVRLWDLTQSPPKPIAVLVGHTDLVRSLAYSPDGKYIASGSRDGTVRRYLARFEDVEALSWEYVPRDPTSREKELFDYLEAGFTLGQ
ncbi:MAG: WD40 repeat domain-containing protein [Chloroflexota bacterium]|nr:WD40 repeat domain-containing protein [Chloroflexota bacterium]